MRPRQRTFTLVEAMIAMIVVSTMLVAALNTVGAARTGECRIMERGRALALAEALMAEILQQAYADPAAGSSSFGIDAGESTGNRSLFDDADDYDGWDASPPQNKDGSVIPGVENYEQVVSVKWVNATDLLTPSGTATGVKRIEVTIKRLGKTVLTLSAYRTVSWVDPAQTQGGGTP